MEVLQAYAAPRRGTGLRAGAQGYAHTVKPCGMRAGCARKAMPVPRNRAGCARGARARPCPYCETVRNAGGPRARKAMPVPQNRAECARGAGAQGYAHTAKPRGVRAGRGTRKAMPVPRNWAECGRAAGAQGYAHTAKPRLGKSGGNLVFHIDLAALSEYDTRRGTRAGAA